jgi:hypothetical protein
MTLAGILTTWMVPEYVKMFKNISHGKLSHP